MANDNSTSIDAAAPSRPAVLIDKDSIHYSKERWRIVPQRLAPMSIQYLLIDSYHDEIIATYPKMSDAMSHRDELLGRTNGRTEQALQGSKCEELAHE